MKSRIILAAAVAAMLGCGHSKHVDRGDTPREDEAPKKEAKSEAQKKKTPTEQQKRPAAGDEKHEKEARAPAEEGRPELTTSAEGLLQPDGPRLIQEKLAEKGYLAKDHHTNELDKETAAALRKFQGDQEVAQTGYPDRETVRKLGLTIAKVFKATGSGKAEGPKQ